MRSTLCTVAVAFAFAAPSSWAQTSPAAATTGITASFVDSTGVTISPYGSGNSQNMPPAQMINYIIFAG